VPKTKKPKPPQLRFGIGEWYGLPLTALSLKQCRKFADVQDLPKSRKPAIPCPFQEAANCNKIGGVCSLRLYEKSPEIGVIKPVTGETGQLRTVCPKRFEEDYVVYRWVGETILGSSNPQILGEIDFLESPPDPRIEARSKGVGRIDNILVVPNSQPFSWCALEFQAVYFQGGAMKSDFDALRHRAEGTLPFPSVQRRPDYRSSGPKRLMPQLQIKVPWLSRWGKKMAVVVDRSFFDNMGRMQTVPHISNCDVAWFVVKYEETASRRYRLVQDDVQFTTLAHSVEGLTAGIAVSQEVFEKRIRARLERLSGPSQITSD
jgi:hypothetical protein